MQTITVKRVTRGLVWGGLLFAAGCISPAWVSTEAMYTSRTQDYTVELPLGWMRWNLDEEDDLELTRDGTLLQYILIERIHLEHKLKHTEKQLRKGMVPQEVAEILLDSFGSDGEISGFAVKDNRPIRISGFPGFRATFTYRTKDGLNVKSVYCGVMTGEWLYGLRYTAPQRYYFDRDFKTFERVLQSFRLKKPA